MIIQSTIQISEGYSGCFCCIIEILWRGVIRILPATVTNQLIRGPSRSSRLFEESLSFQNGDFFPIKDHLMRTNREDLEWLPSPCHKSQAVTQYSSTAKIFVFWNFEARRRRRTRQRVDGGWGQEATWRGPITFFPGAVLTSWWNPRILESRLVSRVLLLRSSLQLSEAIESWLGADANRSRLLPLPLEANWQRCWNRCAMMCHLWFLILTLATSVLLFTVFQRVVPHINGTATSKID